MALGLGLATAIFSFADGYLFKPLPFRGYERSYYVTDPHGEIAGMLKASDLAVLRTSPVAELGWVEWSGGDFLELQLDGRSVQAFSYEVSRDFRRTLELPLIAGRDFEPAEHDPGAPAVAWLTHRFWQREFGGDIGVVGRSFRLNARAPTELRIVGILGPEVSTLDLNNQPPDIVQPERPSKIGPYTLAYPLVRLPDGVSEEQALARIGAALQAAAPARDGRPRTARLVPFESVQLAGGRPTARVFFAGAMLVLLMASMNLIHLFLGRSVAIRREVATRAALGAGRWRIVRGFLVESLMLGAVGIGLGLLTGRALSLVIESRVPAMPTAGRNLSMVPMLFDGRVVAFGLVLGLVVAIAGGLLPALRATRGALASPMRGPSGAVGRLSRGQARLILTSELTVATVVAVGATFIGAGIYGYLNQPLGFDYRDRHAVTLSAEGRRPSGLETAAVLTALRELPGVRAAGSEAAPLNGLAVEAPGVALDPKLISVLGAGPGHFEALGLNVERGRWFEQSEFSSSAPPVVVDARMARLVQPAGDVLGATLRIGGVVRTVVGVVQPRRYLLDREPPATAYVPIEESAGRPTFVVWAPNANAADLGDRLAAAASAAAPGTRVSTTEWTFDRLMSRGIGEANFQAPVMVTFAVLVTLLAGIGLFGIVAFLVEQQRREFGIRLAIGARARDIWRTVLRDAVEPTCLGLLLGAAGARALESVVESKVFGWSASGPIALGMVAAVLLAVAVLAAAVPARRALRIDPAVTLRSD
jgi:predicted permease